MRKQIPYICQVFPIDGHMELILCPRISKIVAKWFVSSIRISVMKWLLAERNVHTENK